MNEKDQSKCRACSTNKRKRGAILGGDRSNCRGGGGEPAKSACCSKKGDQLQKLVSSLKKDVKTICEYEKGVVRCPVAGVPSFEPCKLLSDMMCKLSLLEKLGAPCPKSEGADRHLKKLRMAAVLLNCARNMLCRQLIKECREEREKHCKMVVLLKSLACVEKHLTQSCRCRDEPQVEAHVSKSVSFSARSKKGQTMGKKSAEVGLSKPVWTPGSKEVCPCYGEDKWLEECCPEQGIATPERAPSEVKVVQEPFQNEEIVPVVEEIVPVVEERVPIVEDPVVEEVPVVVAPVVEEVPAVVPPVVEERVHEVRQVEETIHRTDRGLEITSFRLTYTKQSTRLAPSGTGHNCGCCTDEEEEEEEMNRTEDGSPTRVYRKNNDDGGYTKTTYKGRMGGNINLNIEYFTEQDKGRAHEGSFEEPPANIIDLEERVKKMSWVWYESARQLCDQVKERVNNDNPPAPHKSPPPSPTPSPSSSTWQG